MSCCNWRYFTYDSLGQLMGTALSGNAEALASSYGPGGQVTVTDVLTNSTQFFYDHRVLMTKTVDALGNIFARTFDNSFNLISITDPTGRSYHTTSLMEVLAGLSR
jgi:YD repeat-containing protein